MLEKERFWKYRNWQVNFRNKFLQCNNYQMFIFDRTFYILFHRVVTSCALNLLVTQFSKKCLRYCFTFNSLLMFEHKIFTNISYFLYSSVYSVPVANFSKRSKNAMKTRRRKKLSSNDIWELIFGARAIGDSCGWEWNIRKYDGDSEQTCGAKERAQDLIEIQ